MWLVESMDGQSSASNFLVGNAVVVVVVVVVVADELNENGDEDEDIRRY